MKKLELFLIAGAIVGFLLALFDIPLDSVIASVFFTLLGCLYFYFGFALFNDIPFRKIFKAESYKGIDPRKLLMAMGTGISLSLLTIGYLFSILVYPMARTFLILGCILTAIIIILAVINYSRVKDQFFRGIILRSSLFLIIAVIFFMFTGNIFKAS